MRYSVIMAQAHTEMLHARVDSRTKTKASGVLKRVGLDMSEAIRLYLQAIVNTGGVPFPVRVPNAETRRAIEDVRAGRGIRHYETAGEMFRDLKR